MVADARPVWSRELLIDTAVELLHTGGAAAITVDAVTTAAQVSRATLYRQFPGCAELVAAAFHEVVPVKPAAPPPGPWRDRLAAVMVEQARSVTESPQLVAALCWLVLERGSPGRFDDVIFPDKEDATERRALCDSLREWCLVPLLEVLDGPDARAELGEADRGLIYALLIAPVLCGTHRGPTAWVRGLVAAFAAAHAA